MRALGLLGGLVVALVCASPAAGAWHQPVGGASPINELSSARATDVAMATVGGVPYITWDETNATGGQVRVARLNAAGTAWEKVGQTLSPTSPMNFSATSEAAGPQIIGINGVPYVTWYEMNGNWEVRVARLNAAKTGWDRLGTPDASPINKDTTQDATNPTITAIDGVPWVAWKEATSATSSEVRVASYNEASNTWTRVADSASPINVSSTRNANAPVITNVNGVPYVAWRESDGVNQEVRVARLNAAKTAWEKVGDSASPINESSVQSASYETIDSVGGVPYVAWIEDDGTNDEVRVARLNATGTAWEKIADSASPINEASSRDAFDVALTMVNGVPYVGWEETDGAAVEQARVSRLEPEFVSQSVEPGATSATLSAQWRTYGIQFPIGFDYGASLESSTTPSPAPAGVDSPTVSQQVAGLSPTSPYQFRSYATLGVPEPKLLATSATVFNTTAVPDTAPPETKITKEPKAKSSKTKAKYKFKSSEPNSTFVCKFDKAKPKPCDAGKAKFKRLDDGKHKFRVYAVDAAGNADASPAKDKFKVL